MVINLFILTQQFVTDRKIDEEIGYTTRFLYDSDHIMEVSTQLPTIVTVSVGIYSSMSYLTTESLFLMKIFLSYE